MGGTPDLTFAVAIHRGQEPQPVMASGMAVQFAIVACIAVCKLHRAPLGKEAGIPINGAFTAKTINPMNGIASA